MVAHLQGQFASKTMSAELWKYVIGWIDCSWVQLPHHLMATVLLLLPLLRDAVPLTIESRENACMFIYNHILPNEAR